MRALLKRIAYPAAFRPARSVQFLFIAAGFLFAVLWSSASTATKIGLEVAQPFTIAICRFFTAGILMVVITHGIMGNRLPVKKEWRQIAFYGLLNISLYLGCYVLAMQEVSAGLGSLAVAANPVLIGIMSAFWLGHRLRWYNILSILLCLAGVFIAAWPLLRDSLATIRGILILLTGMVAYSASAVYYSRTKWNGLHNLTINAWQTILGGLFLLPVMIYTYTPAKNLFDSRFFGPVSWLAVMVSISAVQLWLYLLKHHQSKGYYWLFLSPVSGFIIAAYFTHEPIGLLTVIGVVLVIGGLYLTLRKIGKKTEEIGEIS